MEKCPNNPNHKIVAVEYWYGHPKHYDGTSEYRCLDEKKRWGRWCGQLLRQGDAENVFCDGKKRHK